MSVLIDPADPRGASAVMLATHSDQWTPIGSAWRIPSRSRPGVSYVVTAASCTCPDQRFGHRCAHQLAAELVQELTDEAAAF